MRLLENTSATLHAESDTNNFKESERKPQSNIAAPKNRTKTAQIEWLFNENNLLFNGAV